MNKEEIIARIETLKKQNDEDNNKLSNLSQVQQILVQQMLVRNGRILELEEWLNQE